MFEDLRTLEENESYILPPHIEVPSKYQCDLFEMADLATAAEVHSKGHSTQVQPHPIVWGGVGWGGVGWDDNVIGIAT